MPPLFSSPPLCYSSLAPFFHACRCWSWLLQFPAPPPRLLPHNWLAHRSSTVTFFFLVYVLPEWNIYELRDEILEGKKNPGRLISVLGALKSSARACSRTHTSSCLSSLHNSSKHSRASFQMMIALNHFSQFGPISFRLWSKRIIPVFSQHPSLWNFGFFVVCALALFMS